jgi:hypothetical protein
VIAAKEKGSGLLFVNILVSTVYACCVCYVCCASSIHALRAQHSVHQPPTLSRSYSTRRLVHDSILDDLVAWIILSRPVFVVRVEDEVLVIKEHAVGDKHYDKEEVENDLREGEK